MSTIHLKSWALDVDAWDYIFVNLYPHPHVHAYTMEEF